MKPLARLAELVAAAPTFRVRAGIEDDDAFFMEKLLEGKRGGTKRVFYPAADLDSFNVFPGAILWPGEVAFEMDSGGHRNFLAASGELSLLLVDRCRYPNDIELSARDFFTFMGQFLEDIASQFAVNDNLAGYRISRMRGPERDKIHASGGNVDRWLCWVMIGWGG